MSINKILDLDIAWINSIQVIDSDIISKVATGYFTNKNIISDHVKYAEELLEKALSCIDLASLVGNETPETIYKLCQQAAFPLKHRQVSMAAVCVYPLRIVDATSAITALGVDKSVLVAAVAAGFPSGQYPLQSRLAEIFYAVGEGATEIDVVIDRSLVLRGMWVKLYEELVQMRKACREATLKVILSVTECGSWTNVYKASAVAMMAGADFIKTSTGKEANTVTMHEGFVMCQAIREFFNRTGVKVGLKPAGGVRTTDQAVSWLLMVQDEVGADWLNPSLFRIGTSGTSSLVGDIAKALKEQVNVIG